MKIWLDTVGKHIFNIRHHWCRFEFAPSRGQIHAHLLAICGDPSFNIAMHELRHDEEAQARLVQNFTKNAFNYEANVDQAVYEDLSVDKSNSPCSVLFSDVGDKGVDANHLLRFCQHHECSGYCLRNKNQKKGKSSDIQRECRAGAGQEATPGCGDTPGFTLRDEPTIIHDKRGFRRVELQRNNSRVVQSSLDMLQSWRGNCDIQVLLYDSDPLNPDPAEIARVTDYVVAYASKGNVSLADEKKQIRTLVMRYVKQINK